MKLKAEYFKQIRDALMDAFNPARLRSMARIELELELDDIAGQNATKPEMVGALIRWAEEQDRVEDLIAGARRDNPTNKKLETAGEKLLSSGEDAYFDIRELAEKEVDWEIAKYQQEQTTIENYFSQMTELLLLHDLRSKTNPISEERAIARAITLTALRSLDDGNKKGQLMCFLAESTLIDSADPILPLFGANLQGADLSGVSMSKVDLSWVDLERADLSCATLREVNLSGANLSRANLRGVTLEGANLDKANLFGADLSMARLSMSKLEQTDLREADLSNTGLFGASFWMANLSGVDLSGVYLSDADLDQARYTIDTRWPPGFDPTEAGAILVDDDSTPTEVISEVDSTADTYTDSKTGLEMIRIPVGVFRYGEEYQLEYLSEFWISKAPVTNALFLRFVKAVRHDPPKHWKGKTPKAELANHPIVYVSWHDAKAYADWAGMHLPTEEEWEKAARGTDGRIYPWGDEWRDEYCNTHESGIGTTTPVGQYSPRGDSPYRCVDMAGNVWEWTASLYDDERDRRVLRGGAWDSSPVTARATWRLKHEPNLSSVYHGFRLVRRLPSVSATLTETGLRTASQEASDSQYYSCFISYSSKDAEFAQKLHDDLQAAGVNCWFAPEDMKIGQRVRVALDSAVMGHHKLLLILSQHSAASDWVEQEVETAFEKERDSGEIVLFPVRLDTTVFDLKAGWAAYIKRTRHIGNFRNWQNEANYRDSLQRVLRDLTIESDEKHV